PRPPAAAATSAGAMPSPPYSPFRPNTGLGSKPCPTTFRKAPTLKPCRLSTSLISMNSRRSNQLEALAAVTVLAPDPPHRGCPGGQTGPFPRAAPSLVRALRGARGSLLFATWTTLPAVAEGSFLHADPGSLLRAD